MTNGPDIVSVEEIAESVRDGATLGAPADYSGVPMAATRALVRRGAVDLDLYCLPYTTLQGDILIGAGAVRSVEAAAVTLGEYGLAPRFSAAVEAGRIEMRDSTCPALHAQLQAVEKDVPFMPLRGVLGSDLLAHRPDWRVIDNPMRKTSSGADDEDRDPIVLLPARPLDVALFHAPYADRDGNVFIGRRRELATMVHAARAVLVTVEKILDDSLFASEATAAGALPAFYVDAIAVAKGGAAPCGLWETYPSDTAALRAYAAAARTQDGFDAWLAAEGLRELSAA